MLTSTAGGADFKIELEHVTIQSVTASAVQGGSAAVGGAVDASAYLTVSFLFKTVEVDASGPDDGGTTLPKQN